MKLPPRATQLLCSTAAGLCLAACGGGEVGGTLTGLGSGLSVALLNRRRFAHPQQQRPFLASPVRWMPMPPTR